MELQGIVKKLGEVQTFPSGFQKREMVVVTEEQYPQPISIEFLKEKGDLLNKLKEGDKVKVSINIGGREWTSPQGDVKYFNSITGWKVEKVDSNHILRPEIIVIFDKNGKEKYEKIKLIDDKNRYIVEAVDINE